MLLAGKSVLVTGAARGLGRACAIACAAEGADLTVMDVCADIDGVPYALGTSSQLESTADQCRAVGGSALVVAGDLRSALDCESAVRAALARYGKCDALINCGGIAAPSGEPAHRITEDQWQLMIDIDLNGAWRMTKYAVPGMIERRAGSIVNVSSTAGLVGYRNFAAYTAAKHGLIGLTKAAALDYGPHQVRVNALCPGSVRDCESVEGVMLREIARALELSGGDHESAFIQSQPMNRLIEPADVAAAALWLVSDLSRQVTGVALPVDGGYTTR
ncbi:SDR family oxidoreductase [Nocardia sp. MW-W600-9]